MIWTYRPISVASHRASPCRETHVFIEAFNGRLRVECLNTHWFRSHTDAAEKLEDWRKDYNEHRPHGAIGSNVPVDLMKSEHTDSPRS
ncbi:MAG: transposase [Roseibium sp.]|nr:transposase [Roseibium sp.]